MFPQMPQCTERFEVGGVATDVDTGGAYVGGTQDKILRVADSLGVKTYAVHKTGTNITEVTYPYTYSTHMNMVVRIRMHMYTHTFTHARTLTRT